MADLLEIPKPEMGAASQTGGSMPSPGTHDFVKTSASARIITGLNLARLAEDLVMVYGEPGVGKTVTLEHYRETYPNVWLSSMSPDTSGKVPMLEELGAAMGLSLSGGAAPMRRQIVTRVRDTGGLIIVDEAQHLSGDALDELRCIHDRAGIGMALCGNPLLKTRVDTLSQVNSRIGKKVRLGRPPHADVAMLAAHFSVDGEDEMRLLHTISCHPGGLRCLVKTLRLASLFAEDEGIPVNAKHLAAAWTDLALEEQA